jgi:hypothetical protein
VALTTGCNHWDEGLDVVVDGDAIQVTSHDTLERLAQAWATKWDGRWQLEVSGDGFRNRSAQGWRSQVFSVTPVKVYAHAKGDPYGATTHKFAASRFPG